MPAPPKPGVDWNQIRREYEAGRSAYELGKRHPVTKQAILLRKDKEGWRDPEPHELVDRSDLETQIRALPSIVTNEDYTSIRTPEKAIAILEDYEKYGGLARAANCVGHHLKSLQEWMEQDPQFSALLLQAKVRFEQERLNSIQGAEKRGDWKASQYLLEKSPATKEQYQGNQEKSGGITVIFQGVPKPGEVIEHG